MLQSQNLYVYWSFQNFKRKPECNELPAVRAEFSEEAWRFLHIDQGEVGKYIGVEPAAGVDAAAPVFDAEYLPE